MIRRARAAGACKICSGGSTPYMPPHLPGCPLGPEPLFNFDLFNCGHERMRHAVCEPCKKRNVSSCRVECPTCGFSWLNDE